MPFKQGVKYKISAVSYGKVLTLADGGDGAGVEIVIKSYTGSTSQLWLAVRAEAGWTLSCADQYDDQSLGAAALPLPERCLDQDLHKKRVTHSIKHGGFNQQWYLQEIAPDVNMFVVKNVANNKCLTSHGTGRRVTCANLEPKSCKQHWAITAIDPPDQTDL